jgi:membrane protease YdiL (CAAX protease family)
LREVNRTDAAPPEGDQEDCPGFVTDSASFPGEIPPVMPSESSRGVARWRWWIHLLLIGAYPLLIAVRAQGRGEPGAALSDNARGLLLVASVELAVFGLVFFLGWLASRASREELLLRWRPRFWVVPLGLGYSVALRMAIGVAFLAVILVLVLTGVTSKDSLEQFILTNRPDVETVVDISALRRDPLYYWLTVTLVSFIVAGLREELWRSGVLAGLRALWPGAFGSRRGQIVAVALIAIVFGVGHWPMGIIAVFMTGLLGLMLGLIMVFHRSIWPAVIAHGAFDATTMALLPWLTEKLQQIKV